MRTVDVVIFNYLLRRGKGDGITITDVMVNPFRAIVHYSVCHLWMTVRVQCYLFAPGGSL